VNLPSVNDWRQLACGAANCQQGQTPALKLTVAKIEGGVFLHQGFKLRESENLTGARLATASCDGCQFISRAIHGPQANVAKIDVLFIKGRDGCRGSGGFRFCERCSRFPVEEC